jgi:hypothetical protein
MDVPSKCTIVRTVGRLVCKRRECGRWQEQRQNPKTLVKKALYVKVSESLVILIVIPSLCT